MGYFVAYLLGIITSQVPQPVKVSDTTCKCCHHKTPWWKVLLDWLTFFAAISAAGAATWYACITRNMWGEMKTSNYLAKTQWEAEHRPWIGLTDITLSSVRFDSKSPSSISTHLEGTMRLENFGNYPGFGANTELEQVFPLPQDQWAKSPLGKPPKVMFTCPDQEKFIQGGEVVFPSRSFLSPFQNDMNWGWKGRNVEVPHVWLLMCISYSDGRHQEPHHTWIWLRSASTPRANWILLSPTARYMPIQRFESWGEEAN